MSDKAVGGSKPAKPPKERVVKDIAPNGDLTLMTRKEECAWRKSIKKKIRNK